MSATDVRVVLSFPLTDAAAQPMLDELAVEYLTRYREHLTEEPKDIAGLKVAVGSGTHQEKILLEWDKENIAAGLKPIGGGEPPYHDQYPDVLLALPSGRIDTCIGPNATAAYSAGTAPDRYKVVDTLNGGWPATAQIAVGTLKGSGLAEAVTAALNHAIDDGSYAKVLARRGLQAEAIDKSETNPPGLPKTS